MTTSTTSASYAFGVPARHDARALDPFPHVGEWAGMVTPSAPALGAQLPNVGEYIEGMNIMSETTTLRPLAATIELAASLHDANAAGAGVLAAIYGDDVSRGAVTLAKRASELAAGVTAGGQSCKSSGKGTDYRADIVLAAIVAAGLDPLALSAAGFASAAQAVADDARDAEKARRAQRKALADAAASGIDAIAAPALAELATLDAQDAFANRASAQEALELALSKALKVLSADDIEAIVRHVIKPSAVKPSAVKPQPTATRARSAA